MMDKNSEEKDDEIVPEDLDDSVIVEEHAGEQIKKLKDKLKEAESKAKEYLDGWQRSQADFVNIRKRDEEAKKEFLKFASESLLIELLPVLDSFDMAANHGSKDLEVVHKQLLSVLDAHGLKVLDPLSETFDPRSHESVSVVETGKEEEDHKILEVLQKGYILSGKIIRPAKVKIGEFKK